MRIGDRVMGRVVESGRMLEVGVHDCLLTPSGESERSKQVKPLSEGPIEFSAAAAAATRSRCEQERDQEKEGMPVPALIGCSCSSDCCSPIPSSTFSPLPTKRVHQRLPCYRTSCSPLSGFTRPTLSAVPIYHPTFNSRSCFGVLYRCVHQAPFDAGSSRSHLHIATLLQ